MGYCWIKKKRFYDANDLQSMLEFLRAKAEMKETRLFLKYVGSNRSLSDANAIRRVMEECCSEYFYHYDSDVAEQFISIFDSLFLSSSDYVTYKATARFVVVGTKTMKDTKKWWILDTTDLSVEACSEEQIFDLVVNHKEPVDGVTITSSGSSGKKRLVITVK